MDPAYPSKEDFIQKGMEPYNPPTSFECCICRRTPPDIISPNPHPSLATAQPASRTNGTEAQATNEGSQQGGQKDTQDNESASSKSEPENSEAKEEKHEIVKFRPCDHVFCKDCVLTWLDVGNTCPVCRHVLFPGARPVELTLEMIMVFADLVERLDDVEAAEIIRRDPTSPIVPELIRLFALEMLRNATGNAAGDGDRGEEADDVEGDDGDEEDSDEGEDDEGTVESCSDDEELGDDEDADGGDVDQE